MNGNDIASCLFTKFHKSVTFSNTSCWCTILPLHLESCWFVIR